MGIYLLLGACIILFGVFAPAMVTPHHLLELSMHSAAMGIVAMGQTVVMLTGMFDLSVGAVMTLINVLGAGMLGSGEFNTAFIVVLLLCLGALIGLINGLGITRLKIPPFMMTLCM
ncbi:MAG: ribose ABC transporter permease, partial [Deltaproteobacteria bacterium]|nr:ribose ABC transporter permease [Deltaproteobacteria bacterium]